MKNYQLNALQFHVLPGALKRSQTEMASELGMSHTVLSKRLKSGDFRINDLLRLCNRYHIRLSSFITTDEMAAFGGDVIVRNEEWHTINFSAKKFESMLERGEVLKKDVTKATGFSHSTIKSVLSEDGQVSRILHLCNMMSINLSDFFDDPTLPQIVPDNKNLRKQNEELQRQVALLRQEVERLRQKIQAMRSYAYQAQSVAEMNVAENGSLKY